MAETYVADQDLCVGVLLLVEPEDVGVQQIDLGLLWLLFLLAVRRAHLRRTNAKQAQNTKQ